MLNFEPKVLRFTYHKKQYEIKYPTIKELKSYQAKIKDSKDVDQFDLMIKFLETLGADKEVILSLTSGQLIILIQELTNEEKKS